MYVEELQPLLCVTSLAPPTPSASPPVDRCPACEHKRGKTCAHERGELPPYPGTLGTVRDDGQSWHEPGDGAPTGQCSCAARDDFSQCGSSSPPAGCRRRSPRCSSVILTARERAGLRRRLARRRACGTRARSLRRLTIGSSGVRETRMTTLTKCGLRECGPCEAAARRYRGVRAEGPWSRMITLTLPHRRMDVRYAWKMMPVWVGRLIRAMQRRASVEGQDDVKPSERALQMRGIIQVETVGRKREVPLVLYAWALEPHKSGYPHAHVALGIRWLRNDWLDSEWGRITGNPDAKVHQKELDDDANDCRYLTKYITKQAWSLDLAAITARQRMFWSAMPAPWSPPSGWTSVQADTQEVSERLVAGHDGAFTQSGWTHTEWEPGRFLEQHRDWQPTDVRTDHAIAPELLPPSGWDGTDREWASMVAKAAAQLAGWWQWREYHEFVRLPAGSVRPDRGELYLSGDDDDARGASRWLHRGVVRVVEPSEGLRDTRWRAGDSEWLAAMYSLDERATPADLADAAAITAGWHPPIALPDLQHDQAERDELRDLDARLAHCDPKR